MKKEIFVMLMGLIIYACGPSEQPYETKTATENGYTYEYVVGDPMNTRIYTLENGLKVYLSDYENAPRVHVFIPVKAGGKNDPADNTGLAHYLEHMMFKGNDEFGTLNYEEEVAMLDSIEQMFNHYGTLEDASDRKAYYAKIDQYSNEAAKLAIPNEYDKMMSMIGAKGLNAYTTVDRTVYTVDIPANEVGRFLKIEGSRFSKIVNRLFHTELEAVYEEKNRSLDNDFWKVYETMYQGAFEKHQYGTQTVIGTIDHLKNPSITEIKNYFNKYYRPNNVAICMSGDIDFNETIQLIDQHFGSWESNKNLPKWEKPEEAPITEPVVKEVYGPDAEFLNLAFRFGGTSSEELVKVKLIDMILNNAEAGLIDLNLKQKQAVLNAGSYVDDMNDYSLHTVYGNAKNNQSLEEVRDLILEQIALVKNGDFDDWLLDAVITDLKKSRMQGLESNWSRANNMVKAFTNNMDWSDYIQEIDKMEKITKEELVAFANENYNDNYVVVYKRNGEDTNKQKVEKPEINKVPLNRENKSDFHQAMADTEVNKLTPAFVNFSEDIDQFSVNNVDVLSKKNKENELFRLTYLLDLGKNADPKMAMAVQYLEFLGTDAYNAEEFKKELYKIGCSFSVFASTERTYVTLSGLDENMEKATALFESLLANPQPDQEALDNMVDRTFKSRSDAKKNKGNILWDGLYNYGKYGEVNPFNDVMANAELQEVQAEELTDIIKGITKLPHRILYYGPREADAVSEFLATNHPVPAEFDPVPSLKRYEELAIDESQVFWTDYDMVQTEIIFLAKGENYDAQNEPAVRLFNEYFGGGMNSIVFQEIREAQGLAYSVFSTYSQPSKKDKANYLFAYVGTQADKQAEAMNAMMGLLNDMPESEEAFNIAKNAILNKIESERITGSGVLWNYISAQDKGLDYDVRKDIYEQVSSIEFENLKSFHENYIKDQKYVTVLVGARDKIDFNALKTYGEVTELSLDELFGYTDNEPIEPGK
ncbi:MAG: insulinase family protein [Cytophagales bacterium]|nr:insulinase family protein [Cytophagales bacterium]